MKQISFKVRTRSVYLSLAAAAVIGFQACSGFNAAPKNFANFTSRTFASHLEAQSPLVVDENSHVVVLQYETWWGPKGMHFDSTMAAKPKLSSKTMRDAGLTGYDSTDPAIIQQHADWFQQMHVDAVQVDLSNSMACTFNNDVARFCAGNAAERQKLQTIRENIANLFSAYKAMNIPLKIIPLLDTQTVAGFDTDSDGTTAFSKQILFFSKLADDYPNQWVIYKGKPLLTLYGGPPMDLSLVTKAQSFLASTGLAAKFTVRFETGMIESQTNLWGGAAGALGLHEVSSNLPPLWSWVDRLRIDKGYVPSYARVDGRVENFTVTSAFPGAAGWGTSQNPAADLGKRKNGQTFKTFMAYAKTLSPTFLFIDQFNEYFLGDQGFDVETTNDLEPTDLWGTGPMEMAAAEIAEYRAVAGSGHTFVIPPGFFQFRGDGAIYNSNGEDEFCSFRTPAEFLAAGGNADLSNVREDVANNGPLAMRNDGACFASPLAPSTPPMASNPPPPPTPTPQPSFVPMAPGFFRLPSGAVYNSNGQGHVCPFINSATYVADGGNDANTRSESEIKPGTQVDGPCVGITPMASGFFRIPGDAAIYFSNGTGAFCSYQTYDQYLAAGGHKNEDNVRTYDGVVVGMRNDGACK